MRLGLFAHSKSMRPRFEKHLISNAGPSSLFQRVRLSGLHQFRAFSTLKYDKVKKFTIDLKTHSIDSLSTLVNFTANLYSGSFDAISSPSVNYKDDAPSIPPQMKFWFRGHAIHSWDLVPTAHRFNESDDTGFYESPLITGFELNHPEFDTRDSVFSTISKMQHYRYPTRLLDWSSNITVALYFTCCDPTLDEEDGRIWILDPFRLNEVANISAKSNGIALEKWFDSRIRSYLSVVETFEDLKEYAHQILNSIKKPNEIQSIEDFHKYLNELSKNDEMLTRLEKPIAVDPGHINPRLAA